MRKIICLSIVILFVIGLTGCGKNPVFTHVSGSPSTEKSASMAAYIAKTAVIGTTSCANISDGSAPSYSGAPGVVYKGTPTVDPQTGWITIEGEGVTLKFRYLKADGSPIRSSTFEAILGLATQAKKMEFEVQSTYQDTDGYSYSATANATLTFNTIGDLSMSNGGSISGTINGSINDPVLHHTYQYQVKLTNAVVGTSQVIASGTIDATLIILGETWAVHLTFNNDGSVDGTITGPGYTATVHINADGTGTYTDSSGTHTIS